MYNQFIASIISGIRMNIINPENRTPHSIHSKSSHWINMSFTTTNQIILWHIPNWFLLKSPWFLVKSWPNPQFFMVFAGQIMPKSRVFDGQISQFLMLRRWKIPPSPCCLPAPSGCWSPQVPLRYGAWNRCGVPPPRRRRPGDFQRII